MTRMIAVIDIGSNSGRVVVLRSDRDGVLEPRAEARVPLRLVRGLDRGGALDDESIDHALAALADFRAVAQGAGAGQVVAVATAAVREASNGAAFVQRITDEIGLDVRILDGEDEARRAVLGAIHGIDCEDGLVVDVGGGSMQVAQFEQRQVGRTWSLPLGALRLSDLFLDNDPPAPDEIAALYRHVQSRLDRAGVPQLPSHAVLVGTGGTIRNLARIDRKATGYPIPRVHGYPLALVSVKEIEVIVAARMMRDRRAVPGLNEDRVDSIVGGTVAIHALMDALNAPEIVVSGQGLREGVGYSLLAPTMPSTEAVRRGSLLALARRFTTWDATVAARRQSIASAIFRVLEPRPRAELTRVLEDAALLLDVGRSVDYYRRFAHASDIVCTADLAGATHRSLALLAATLRFGGDGGVRLKPFSPLLGRADKRDVQRAAATLGLADAIESRCLPGPIQVECERRDGTIRIAAPLIPGASIETARAHFESATSHRLEATPRG